MAKVLVVLTTCAAMVFGAAVMAQAPQPKYYDEAMGVASFILGLQDNAGAVVDQLGGDRVNEDSNMEYALSGLAAAYDASSNPRYLQGLEAGIRWLAAREDMSDSKWRGSWFYAYSSTPPYEPVAIKMGNGIINVRGVDATSSLFVYLLLRYQELSGSDALTVEFEANARAALDFIIDWNKAPDGFFYSSWQLHSNDGKWHLWKYEYSADQGDVYLGLRAGFLLYVDQRYGDAADFLKANLPAAFFMNSKGRYTLGRDASGARDKGLERFDGIFPQGYLPWIFGVNDQNLASRDWLIKHMHRNGAVVVRHGPAYSLSIGILIMASTALAKPVPGRCAKRLAKRRTRHSGSGGVVDSNRSHVKYSNVAGFTVIALLYEAPYRLSP